MTTRAIYDHIGEFRAATERMKNTCTDTYVCGCCGGFKSIAGRKPMPSPGRRRLYISAACLKAKEAAK